jgi:Fe(3+) dicitrate transport protein
VRYEYIRTQAQGTYHQYVTDLGGTVIVDSVITDNIDRSRSFVFAGLGMTYRLPTLELYGNVSQNYRAITFSDLRVVNPNLTVDPNIRDEHGFNADLGVRGMLGSVAYIDATAFFMNYADRIGTVLRADQAPLYVPYRYRTNIADARTIGLEAMIDVDILRAFTVQSDHALHAFVNGAVMDARYDAPMDPTVDDREVELVPPVQVRVGATWTVDAWTTSLQYSWTARHYTDATNAEFVSSAVAGIVPSYGVMDLTLCYRMGMWCVEGGVNNVLDARYFSRRADGYPGPGIIPGDARSLFVTIGMRL